MNVVNFGHKLSQRENQVVQLICKGHTGPEIAKILNLAYQTVKNYSFQSMLKLGAKNRPDMVVKYLAQKNPNIVLDL